MMLLAAAGRGAILAIAGLFLYMPVTAHADWPKRVFAPYMYVGTGDQFRLTDCDDAIGLKCYTLAFINADKMGKPAWNSNAALAQNQYLNQIAAIRRRGGDVICSFGGEGGHEIALTQTDPLALEAAYQSVIDRFKFTWLDFDIEGDNLEKHSEVNERRNVAIAALQKKNPGLIISYTLPSDPDGFSEASRHLLVDAKAKGVAVHSANAMVMYFGKRFVGHGQNEAELAIAAAKKTHEQTQTIDSAIQIGLCPCIGTNGDKNEVFTQADAITLRAFADKTDWVCFLSYWSINRDSGKPVPGDDDSPAGIPRRPWDYAKIFLGFEKTK